MLNKAIINQIFERVYTERQRQDELKASGKFLFTCADHTPSQAEKLAILTEETGECAREVCDMVIDSAKEDRGIPTQVTRKERLQKLRTELIQVMAVSLAWVESLDEVLER